eukprot:jgi/Botrbrau1/10361/Bobra.0321s0035.1
MHMRLLASRHSATDVRSHIVDLQFYPCSSLDGKKCRRRDGFGVRAGGGNGKNENRARSGKGGSFDDEKRRRGRPAWQRSPDDTPMRDGNRDRVIGLVTERAARTLCYYLSETNLNVYHWLMRFMDENPIPKQGRWDDVSGETFLRTLLSMPVSSAKFETGRDEMYDCTVPIGVDPRNIAQRIMDIRTQIAKEMTSDLKNIGEENAALMRETLQISFLLDQVAEHPLEAPLEGTSSGGTDVPPVP